MTVGPVPTSRQYTTTVAGGNRPYGSATFRIEPRKTQNTRKQVSSFVSFRFFRGCLSSALGHRENGQKKQ